MTMDAWVEKHCAIFGFLNDQEILMVTEWGSMLAESGCSPDECYAASRWIAANDAPRFRSGHYPALVKRIGLARLAESLARRNEEQRIAEANSRDQECRDCFGIGYVKVPHLASVRDGEWFHPFYSFDVFCECNRGKVIESREPMRITNREKTSPQSAKQKSQMSLAEYRVKNPSWREQIRKRDEEFSKARVGAIRSGTLDRELGEIISRAKRAS